MAAHVAPILRLSDEILVHIFNFVPFIDRSSLSNVCERFRIIIEDKIFHRCVDLSYCYRLSLHSLKNLLTRKSCKSIQVLNLNGCYWIPRADLMTIGKLVNLKELHILHCNVSVKLLLSITKSMSLVGLSWTVAGINDDRDLDVLYSEGALRNIFGQLEELIILLKVNENCLGSSITFLMVLLCYCANLQTLEVRNITFAAYMPQLHIVLDQAVDPDLKKLRSLKLHFGVHLEHIPPLLTFCTKVLKSSTPGKNWLNLWIPNCEIALGEAIRLKRFALTDLASARDVFIRGGTNFNEMGVPESCEFKCRKLGIHNALSEECMEFMAKKFVNVKEIIMQNCRINSEEEISILAMMAASWKNITHLNLISCHIPNKRYACATLANMKALTHLSVNACLIATIPFEVVGFQKENDNFSKKMRIGLVTDSPDDLSVEENTGLGLLTKGCPLLQYLEISGTCSGTSSLNILNPCKNGCLSLKDKALNAIFRWKYLKSLTLKNLPTLGQCVFLIAVGKNCPLQTLRLKAVGGTALCTYNASLITTLHHCTNLLDFSMWQHYINLDSLFTALSECSKLVRIAVVDGVGYRSYDAMETGIAQMFTRLQNLLVFYLVVTATSKWCRDCQTHLNTKFLKDRPPLSVMISKDHRPNKNTLPDYHLEEMLYF